MRQNQLDRLSALRLLFRYNLLQPQSPILPRSFQLVVTGKELVVQLAAECDIVLIPAVPQSPLLQGSRATFKPLLCLEISYPRLLGKVLLNRTS
jgi:hypothetical protein